MALVVCKSSTVFSKRYAERIAEKLGPDVLPLERKAAIDLSKYDTLVYGGGIMAGRIQGVKFFIENRPKFKQAFLFACGASPAGWKELDD